MKRKNTRIANTPQLHKYTYMFFFAKTRIFLRVTYEVDVEEWEEEEEEETDDFGVISFSSFKGN